MKKNFMRMLAAVMAVMTVSANAYVCSAEESAENIDDPAVYDENAYADNEELQEIFDMYNNFEGGENEDGEPLLLATPPVDIDGGDPSTWSPTPLDEEENTPIEGADPSTWSPYPLDEEENTPITGDDPSTWSPTPLDEEENTPITGDDPSTWGPEEDEPLEISPAPIADMPNLTSVRTAALIARKAAEGKLSELSESYDANGDGKVNVRDAAFIANNIAKK